MIKEDKQSEKQIGNIYQFAQNKHYYDSLDSIDILRNDRPRMGETGHKFVINIR